MNFEDVECLKDAFTLYNISAISPPHPSVTKTLFVLRKRSVTYTRVVLPPPVYGVKHHFKMLIRSMFSKLKLTRDVNN
jgi:hypothetical protein